MVKCVKCGKEFDLSDGYRIVEGLRADLTQYGIGNHICNECNSKLIQGRIQEREKQTKSTQTEIKCPFCENKFAPRHVKNRTRSFSGNVIKGAVFLPWGVVSAVKTAKTIDVVCPHCGMTVQSKPR